MRSFEWPFLFSVFLLAGCTPYEFNLTQPTDLARHIGHTEKSAATLSLPPLEYRMRAYEGRLVMTITNNAAEAIELVGDQSYAVDPEGQSHPLRNQTIAPHSFIRIAFPPLRTVYPAGPVFGFGMGYSYWDRGSPWYGDYGYGSPYYLVASDDNSHYWTWEDESTVRVRLTYRRDKETFHHEFTFQRVKATGKR